MIPTYECDQCGACCDGTLVVTASVRDARREPLLIPYLNRHIMPKRVHLTVAPDGKLRRCPLLLHDGLCSIYETRPHGCAAMEAGTEECQEARKLKGIIPLEPS